MEVRSSNENLASTAHSNQFDAGFWACVASVGSLVHLADAKNRVTSHDADDTSTMLREIGVSEQAIREYELQNPSVSTSTQLEWRFQIGWPQVRLSVFYLFAAIALAAVGISIRSSNKTNRNEYHAPLLLIAICILLLLRGVPTFFFLTFFGLRVESPSSAFALNAAIAGFTIAIALGMLGRLNFAKTAFYLLLLFHILFIPVLMVIPSQALDDFTGGRPEGLNEGVLIAQGTVSFVLLLTMLLSKSIGEYFRQHSVDLAEE